MNGTSKTVIDCQDSVCLVYDLVAERCEIVPESEALETNPEEVSFEYYKDLFQGQGSVDELEFIVQSNPRAVWPRLHLAEILLQDDPHAAARFYQEIVQIRWDSISQARLGDPLQWRLTADKLLETGHDNDAAQMYRSMIAAFRSYIDRDTL